MRFESMLGLVGVSLISAACSLTSLSYPRAGASQREVVAACGGKHDAALYPLADATWVLSGVLDVYLANSELEKKEDPTSRDIDKAYRALGYASVVIGGVSMIHGIAVAVDCASKVHRPRAVQSEAAARGPSTAPFPWSVLGYEFGMRSDAAKGNCEKNGGTWVPQQAGAAPMCEQRAPNPLVRLSFELGGLTEIVLVYKPEAGRVDKVFGELEASLRGFYGNPSGSESARETRPKGSLEEQLSRGEPPPPLVWAWPKGAVELIPAVEDEEAVVRLRYRREVGAGP